MLFVCLLEFIVRFPTCSHPCLTLPFVLSPPHTSYNQVLQTKDLKMADAVFLTAAAIQAMIRDDPAANVWDGALLTRYLRSVTLDGLVGPLYLDSAGNPQGASLLMIGSVFDNGTAVQFLQVGSSLRFCVHHSVLLCWLPHARARAHAHAPRLRLTHGVMDLLYLLGTLSSRLFWVCMLVWLVFLCAVRVWAFAMQMVCVSVVMHGL